jgi:23S rRNA (cytosine1962-C5)-methyltransferase
MQAPVLRLKKNEERRLRAGHVWVYSNEIDVKQSPLKSFSAGQPVRIESHDKSYLGMGYVNPSSLIAARLVSRKALERIDVDLFIKRIKFALAWREQFYAKPFYRLIFGESDRLPGLVVDRFEHHLAVQINTAGMDIQTDIIIAALLKVLPKTESILLRNDSNSRKQEGLDTYVKAGFGTPPDELTLIENNTKFSIPFLTGQKTGWFYDHGLNRSRLAAYVKNKVVLDVFSYLGGWGIQAATAGALSVTCVDASETATQYITQNAALNQVSDKVSVICDDAFDALKKLAQEKKTFDVIILDPPAFAKKFKDKKEGLIAYQRINEAAIKLLAPQGVLISCSCSMHIDFVELTQAIRKASIAAHTSMHVVERGHQAPDHPVHLCIPETDYLKMIIARRIN